MDLVQVTAMLSRGADSTGGTLRATRVMGMAIAMQVTASQHVLKDTAMITRPRT